MNIVKIVWLYNDLLDLYGDSGNISIISKRLKQMGCEVDIVHKGIHDSIGFEGANLVYIGPGRPKNLARVSQHFVGYAEVVKSAIESDVNFLVTGNARLLFGKSFSLSDGSVYEGIGLFDYTGIDTAEVFTSDVVSRLNANMDVRCYGFINRSSHLVGGNIEPMFRLDKGAGDTQEQCEYEGNFYRQYFGTWQMGPIMVKNPQLLRFLLARICPGVPQNFDDKLEKKALELTLTELA